MPHKFGFVTRRDKNNKSGLDYTKSVIVETKSIPTYLIVVTGISFAEYQKIKKSRFTYKKISVFFVQHLYSYQWKRIWRTRFYWKKNVWFF